MQSSRCAAVELSCSQKMPQPGTHPAPLAQPRRALRRNPGSPDPADSPRRIVDRAAAERSGAALVEKCLMVIRQRVTYIKRRSRSIDVVAVGHVYYRRHAGRVVDSVDDPVSTATRAKPVVHRGKQPNSSLNRGG